MHKNMTLPWVCIKCGIRKMDARALCACCRGKKCPH